MYETSQQRRLDISYIFHPCNFFHTSIFRSGIFMWRQWGMMKRTNHRRHACG